MRFSEGYLCVYSITDRMSFEAIASFRESIIRQNDLLNKDHFGVAALKVPIIIVGNKLDLDSKRVVTQQEGKELAASFGCLWMETSAMQGIRVEDAFHELLREARRNETRNQGSTVGDTKRAGRKKCEIV